MRQESDCVHLGRQPCMHSSVVAASTLLEVIAERSQRGSMSTARPVSHILLRRHLSCW
jgi:hypothetical protein